MATTRKTGNGHRPKAPRRRTRSALIEARPPRDDQQVRVTVGDDYELRDGVLVPTRHLR